jgi:hypothetical protein
MKENPFSTFFGAMAITWDGQGYVVLYLETMIG